MIMVLLHHAAVPGNGWILAFHMPLFFLLTGYLESFHEKQQSFLQTVKGKLVRLVLPYFLFEAILFVVYHLWMSQDFDGQNLLQAVRCVILCSSDGYTGFYGRLWFWPCMFMADLYFWGIRKITREKQAGLWLAAAGMLAATWGTIHLIPGRLPFAADNACMGTVFIIIGYALRKEIRWILEQKHWFADTAICMTALLGMRLCVRYGQGVFLMHANRYGPLLWSAGGAFCGCAAFLVLGKWMYHLLNRIGVGKKLVLWYGTNSLAVFPVHLAIKTVIADILFYWVLSSDIGILLRYSEQLIAWYVLFPAMLLGSIPIVNIITLYMPFLLGKMPNWRKNALESKVIDK